MEVDIPDQGLAARCRDAWKTQPGLGEPERQAARDSFQKNSTADHVCLQRCSVAWHTGFAKKPSDLLHLIFHLYEPKRLDHLANGDFCVIRPEEAAVFILVVAKSDFVAVLLPERFAFLEFRTPRKDGVAEVQLLDKDLPWRFDLGNDSTGRLENRGIVAPRAGDDIVTVLQSSESRLSRLW